MKTLIRIALLLIAIGVALVAVVFGILIDSFPPRWPEISNPSKLHREADALCRQYFPQGKLTDSDNCIEVPRSDWPIAIEVLRPRHVFVAPDCVDLMISSGGISPGTGYGYQVWIGGEARPDHGISKYSGVAPEDERAGRLILMMVELFFVAIVGGTIYLFRRAGKSGPKRRQELGNEGKISDPSL